MAWDSRIRIERHLSEITAEVRTADADAMNSNQSFAFARFIRLGNIDQSELKWFFELNRAQVRFVA